MANETTITIIGNLTDAPELRYIQSGDAVASFTVASTPRAFDKQANEWKDGETLFMRCSVWREAAENAAESLQKGTRVIVQGRLKARSYETKEGERRTSTELEVDEIGPSLRYATARAEKVSRNGGQQGGYGAPQQGGYGQQAPQQQQGGGHDPWKQNTGGNDLRGNWPEQGQQRPAQQAPQQGGGYGPPQGGGYGAPQQGGYGQQGGANWPQQGGR